MRSPLLILLLLFFPLFLKSQDTAGMEIPCSFNITWRPPSAGEENFSSKIIRDIAYDAVKDIRQVNINAGFDLEYQIVSTGETYFRILFKAKDLVLSGNTIIRGFDVSQILRPSGISISFFQCRKADSLVKHRETWKNIPFCLDTVMASTVMTNYEPSADTIIINVEDLVYSAEDYGSFKKHIQLINDYYACSAVLDSLRNMSETEDLYACSNIPVDVYYVMEICKAVDLIGDRDFGEKLSLKDYDPNRFMEKYREMFRLSRSLRMTFLQKLDASGALDIPASCDPSAVFAGHFYRYIRWSFLVNSRNGPVYEDYLDQYFLKDAFDDDKMIIRRILAKIYPDKNESESYSIWIKNVSDAFENSSALLMKEARYAEAEKMMDMKDRFYNYVGAADTNPYSVALRINALNGIYDSYLGIAESSMQHGKHAMAEAYLSKAQEFRMQHPGLITSDSLFRMVATQLIDLRLSECDTLAGHGFYDEAINCYRNMNLVYDSLTTKVLKNQLREKTDYCLFHSYRNAGVYYIENENPTEAGRFLHMACGIQAVYGYPADTLLDSLCRVTFPYYLVSILKSREELIWTNRLDEARILADSVSRVAGENAAADHPGLSAYLNKFRRKISDKECYDATNAWEILNLRAQRNYEMNNYLRGNMLMDSGLIIARAHPLCAMDTLNQKNAIEKNRPAALFQQMMKNAGNLISMNNYRDAIDIYQSGEDLFRAEKLETFGLSCTALSDFLSSRDNSLLVFEGASHFVESRSWRNAFRMLKTLRMQEFPVKETTDLQKQVAEGLASADFNESSEPESYLMQYIGSDKWFSEFRSAYLHQWKNMKK